MVKVTAEGELNATVAGVTFRNGEAETDNAGALAYFRRNARFTVEDDQPKRRAASASPRKGGQ
jgi:hypothetical protein